MLSCKTHGFCPSCHSKRLEEWTEWIGGELLLDVPHRQIVFTVPKMLRLFFCHKRALLSPLSQAAVHALLKYFHAVTGLDVLLGVVAVIQTFGNRINFYPHIHVLVTERGTAPDGAFHDVSRFHDEVIQEIFTHQVFSLMLRKKLIGLPLAQKILRWRHTGFNVHNQVRTQTKREAERVSKGLGWVGVIRKVYEVDPLLCPK